MLCSTLKGIPCVRAKKITYTQCLADSKPYVTCYYYQLFYFLKVGTIYLYLCTIQLQLNIAIATPILSGLKHQSCIFSPESLSQLQLISAMLVHLSTFSWSVSWRSSAPGPPRLCELTLLHMVCHPSVAQPRFVLMAKTRVQKREWKFASHFGASNQNWHVISSTICFPLKKSYGLPRIKRCRNRSHFWVGRIAKLTCKQHAYMERQTSGVMFAISLPRHL